MVQPLNRYPSLFNIINGVVMSIESSLTAAGMANQAANLNLEQQVLTAKMSNNMVEQQGQAAVQLIQSAGQTLPDTATPTFAAPKGTYIDTYA